MSVLSPAQTREIRWPSRQVAQMADHGYSLSEPLLSCADNH